METAPHRQRNRTRYLIAAILAVFGLSGASAQSHFVGAGGAAVFSVQDTPLEAILAANLHVGGKPADSYAWRLAGNASLGLVGERPAYRLAVDALYTPRLAPFTQAYLGGGGGIFYSPCPPPDAWLNFCFEWLPLLHVTAGLEHRVAPAVGLFGEVQLIYIAPMVQAGVNLYF